jgi:hypothetical protein
VASERRQLALLGAILLVFVGVVYWQMTRDDVPAAAAVPPAGASATPARPAKPVAPAQQVPAVALDALTREAAEPVDTGRDLFRFDESGRAASGAGGRNTAPPAPVQAAPAAPVVPAGPVVPPGPPPPPPILLKFIGTARQGTTGRQLAVLRDDRGIYYGAEGDVIEGRYRLLRVSGESVDVAYIDGRGRKTLPLAGGQS